MKLTDEQKKEKLARDNIRRLINRVSSEYSFRKWRNLRGYLHSIGSDKAVIESTQDKELTRIELDELLRQYEEAAFKALAPRPISFQESTTVLPGDKRSGEGHNGDGTSDTVKARTDSKVEEPIEKFTEKNNYGLSKSEKENITLFWFQKKASAELLKGFTV